MRNLIITVLVSSIYLCSCKEILPDKVVQATITDTVYKIASSSVPQDRVVLIEEFTGASCVNCPAGHQALKEISTKHGAKTVIIGLHYGSLAAPVKKGEQDLRTTEAQTIASTFAIAAMPLALIDRWKDPSIGRTFGRTQWSTAVDGRVKVPANANIKTSLQFDNTKQQYAFSLEIELLEDITDPLNYSIALVENKISVTQKDGAIEIEDYDQEHVTRKFFTEALGNTLPNIKGATKYEKGTVIKKQIYVDGLKAEWKTDNMYMVAFVTRETSASKEVLQASQVSFK